MFFRSRRKLGRPSKNFRRKRKTLPTALKIFPNKSENPVNPTFSAFKNQSPQIEVSGSFRIDSLSIYDFFEQNITGFLIKNKFETRDLQQPERGHPCPRAFERSVERIRRGNKFNSNTKSLDLIRRLSLPLKRRRAGMPALRFFTNLFCPSA